MKLAVILVAASAIAMLMPPATADEEHVGVPKVKLETSASVRVADVERVYDETGAMTLPVGGIGLTLLLQERDLYGRHGREIYTVSDDGTHALTGYVTARNFVGRVAGAPGSVAFVTTDAGTSAIYGTVYLNERAYSLIGERAADGSTLLKTRWSERPTPAPVEGIDGMSALSAGHETYIRVFGDSSYRSAHSDWTSRISAAFNAQHGMWDGQTDIHQWHGPYTAITGGWSTDCATHIGSFRTFLSGQSYTDDAYQEFTGVDLSGCYGRAGTNCTLGTTCAASIVESRDHSCCDPYDPDESDDLGLVSGQELAHNYGEPDHPQDQRCEWYWWSGGPCGDWTYNIMATGTDHDERNFWLTTGSPHTDDSAGQIRSHSHSQL